MLQKVSVAYPGNGFKVLGFEEHLKTDYGNENTYKSPWDFQSVCTPAAIYQQYIDSLSAKV